MNTTSYATIYATTNPNFKFQFSNVIFDLIVGIDIGGFSLRIQLKSNLVTLLRVKKDTAPKTDAWAKKDTALKHLKREHTCLSSKLISSVNTYHKFCRHVFIKNKKRRRIKKYRIPQIHCPVLFYTFTFPWHVYFLIYNISHFLFGYIN